MNPALARAFLDEFQVCDSAGRRRSELTVAAWGQSLEKIDELLSGVVLVDPPMNQIQSVITPDLHGLQRTA